MRVIDKVAPIKERRMKQNSQKWFDGEIADEITNRDKLFQKFKKSKLHFDKDIYNAARYKVRKMIFNKNRSNFLKKLNEPISKPKDLRKAITSLWLSNKTSPFKVNALKINNTVEHDAKSVLEGFKNCYSTLVENLILSHLSINSLRNKLQSIADVIQGIFDIFLLSETKIDESFPDKQFRLNNDRVFRKDRNRYGGWDHVLCE